MLDRLCEAFMQPRRNACGPYTLKGSRTSVTLNAAQHAQPSFARRFLRLGLAVQRALYMVRTRGKSKIVFFSLRV